MGVMSETTAELLVTRALATAGMQGGVGFTFQGGEPTIAGKQFFRAFIEIVKRLNTGNVSVNYRSGLPSLQKTISLLEYRWMEIRHFTMNFV